MTYSDLIMSIYSFIDVALNVITKQALKMIYRFRKGRADLPQLQTAFKALASAGNHYKNPDNGYDFRCKDYYWLNNDYLENIDGDSREIKTIEKDQIVSCGNIYVKVKPSECNAIDFNRI